jgi:superfamily II DNA or RNA helicase
MKKRNEIQQEALYISVNNHRIGIGLGVGTGKTLVGLKSIKSHTIKSMFGRFLVVAPKKAVFNSWKEEAVKWKLEEILDSVTFTTYLSLNKHDPSKYDMIILDECHSLKDSHRLFLSNFKGKILGLTGTPIKFKKSEKGLLLEEFCPIKYTYFVDEAIEDNVLNDYTIIVHSIELDTHKNHKVSFTPKGSSKNAPKREFYTSEKENYNYLCNSIDNAFAFKTKQFKRIMRMKAMMDYRSKERHTKDIMRMTTDKCIVFCNTKDQADRMCIHSYHSGNSDDVNEENLRKFNSGEIQYLACVLQLSEGINIKDLKTAIVLHSYGNERKFLQRFGRLMRLKPNEKAIIHLFNF